MYIRGDYLIWPIRVGFVHVIRRANFLVAENFSLLFPDSWKATCNTGHASKQLVLRVGILGDLEYGGGQGDGLSGGGGWFGRRRGTVVSRQGSGVGVLRQRSVMPNGG